MITYEYRLTGNPEPDDVAPLVEEEDAPERVLCPVRASDSSGATVACWRPPDHTGDHWQLPEGFAWVLAEPELATVDEVIEE